MEDATIRRPIAFKDYGNGLSERMTTLVVVLTRRYCAVNKTVIEPVSS